MYDKSIFTKKKKKTCCNSTRHFSFKDTNRLKGKLRKKRSGVAELISNKTDLKTNFFVARDKEGYL